jgi:hypothetical protein
MLETPKKAKLLYYALIIASLFGTVMPIVSQVSKLKYKSNLKERLTEHLGSDFFNNLIFGMIDALPKWHDMNVLASHGIYSAKWAAWNFLFMLALLIFHKKTLKLITSLTIYYERQKTIFAAVIFILLSFPSTFYWGFWFLGVGGWDYRLVKSTLISFEKNKYLHDPTNNFLLAGINIKNFKNYVGPGCLKNQVVIGFRNGEKFAINDGIAGFVRAAFFHKFMQPPEINHQEVPWLHIINHRMKKISNENKFWKHFKYPNHSVYMPLPFDTSGIDGFEKIEYWDVTVCFDGTEVFIAEADLAKTYD